jgi:uncharacterized protein (TIGR02246 family)
MHTEFMREKLGCSDRGWHIPWAICLVGIAWLGGSQSLLAADAVSEIRQAAAGYVEAFQKADAAALREQWTERATLVEGGEVIHGRSAIVAGLVAWRNQHPGCTLAVDVSDIDVIAEPLARVSGVIRFTPKPGDKPLVSRFTSLRVREGNTWRIAESVVEPERAAALDELDWLLGTWKASGKPAEDGGKTEVEITYEKPVGDFCIVGHAKYQAAGRPAVTALEVIHADRESGLVRCWVFDSSGTRAEGVIESDGTTYHQSMTGTPSEGVPGNVAKWVQVIAPTGEGRCTVHAIERSIDDVPVPDGEPLHFQKVSKP